MDRFLSRLDASGSLADMESQGTWSPGRHVKLIGPRVVVHTLSETDIDDGLSGWMGSTERNHFVWKPALPQRDYILGLIRHCDRISTFVFGIRSGASDPLVGYRKVQIVTEDAGRGMELTAIPTTVIGDGWAGRAYGQEAGALNNWFLVRSVGVRAVSPRIYEANVQTWSLAEKLGYRLVRRFEEATPQGPLAVRCYTITAEELAERWTGTEHFRMELP